jgi:ubiquinone/menaquinone biosynthesis C-methylase UbiE
MTHWTEELFLDDAETFAVTMRERVGESEAEIDHLQALLDDHDRNPETALDVACGIGRHAVELAASGIDVHGIDIAPEYVDSARERAADAGVTDRASFEVADMRNLSERDQTYDLVTNLWTAFGYFDEETNEAVAEGFRDSVAPGGALVMELANKEAVMGDYQESSASRGDGLLYVERSEYTPETGRMETTMTLFEYDETAPDEDPTEYDQVGEMTWDTRLYSPAELRRLLERAGFSTVSLYGGLDGTPLETDSHRVVVVAEP